MSAASSAAAMIAPVLSMRSDAAPFRPRPRSDRSGPVGGWGAAARMSASSSLGWISLVIWAAAVEPADVPMVRSASVTSNPASNRPAMTPISHALPVDPAPPRTKARLPAARARLMASTWRLDLLASPRLAGNLSRDHVEPVPHVDAGDRTYQGRQLLFVVVTGCLVPHFVRYWVRAVAEPGGGLSQR